MSLKEKIRKSSRIYGLIYPKRLASRSLFARIFSARNYRKNSAIAKALPKDRYLCRQNSGTPADRLRFGLSSFARSGCEVMALCNVLIKMNVGFDIAEVIRSLERGGASLAGLLGTAPAAIARVLEERGLDAGFFGRNYAKDYDRLAQSCEACVFTFWWGGRSLVIHTVMLEKQKDGSGITAVNLFKNEDSTDFYSIESMIRSLGLEPLSLITVKPGHKD